MLCMILFIFGKIGVEGGLILLGWLKKKKCPRCGVVSYGRSDPAKVDYCLFCGMPLVPVVECCSLGDIY